MALKLDARSDVEATTHNVIAEVSGTELARETVLISAQLDSWDLCQGVLVRISEERDRPFRHRDRRIRERDRAFGDVTGGRLVAA